MPAAKCYFDAHLHHLSLDPSTGLPFPHTISHSDLNTALRSKAYRPKTANPSLSTLLLLHPLSSASPPALHLLGGLAFSMVVVSSPLPLHSAR